MVCNKHNPRVDYCPFCKVAELQQELAMEKESSLRNDGISLNRITFIDAERKRLRQALVEIAFNADCNVRSVAAKALEVK